MVSVRLRWTGYERPRVGERAGGFYHVRICRGVQSFEI
jgi:hypothetical protein